MAITMAQIAEAAGVSRPTVSAVLAGKKHCYASEETKARIFEAARKLKYTPNIHARCLKGIPSRTIAIVSHLFHVDIHSRLIACLIDEFAAKGYKVILENMRSFHENKEAAFAQLVSYGIEGIISHAKIVKDISPEKQPFMNIPLLILEGDAFIDSEKAFNILAEHLIKTHDLTKIAFLTDKVDNNLRKLKGYKKALKNNNLPFDSDLILESGEFNKFLNKLPDLLKLSKKNKVDAVMCTNDTIAGHTIRFMNKNRINVPDKLAVTGYDGLPFTQFSTPTISTMRQPVEDLAPLVVKKLIAQIESKTPKRNTRKARLEAELLLGESCGCKHK